MNIFEQWQMNNYPLTEDELKRLFRQMAKRLHPDSTRKEDHASFIRLKEDYEESLQNIRGRAVEKEVTPFDPQLCFQLFQDLTTLSFPVVARLQNMNHYRNRILQMNQQLGKRGKSYENLFLKVQRELLLLRENKRKAIDVFLVIKRGIKNYSDVIIDPRIPGNHKNLEHDLLMEKLKREKLTHTIRFINGLKMMALESDLWDNPKAR